MMTVNELDLVELEIQQRESQIARARLNLIDFAEYVEPWYRAARHHHLVAEKLEGVARYIESEGEEGIGRLMVFMPPRHGKSELISRMFPAWMLGRNPDISVILACYGADLAQEDSGYVRDRIISERYQDVFGVRNPIDDTVVEVRQDIRSRKSWHLKAPHRGRFTAAGIGGAIVGRGAHLGIIDDPFKTRKDADSELYRKDVMKFYQGVFRTRLEKGAAVILTHTRWHREDLAGELLMDMAAGGLAEQWEVVFLPALALSEDKYPTTEKDYLENLLRGVYMPLGGDPLGRKEGEALWPEKYNETALAVTEHTVQDDWPPQYQQLPEEEKGAFFIDEMFKLIEEAEVPGGLNWVCYIDLAKGKSETADWNTALMTALDGTRIIYRDMLRVHDLDDFLPELKLKMLSPKNHGAMWRFEDVAFQSEVLQRFLNDPAMANIDIGMTKPDGDKVLRARSLRSRAKEGLVCLVNGFWVRDFLRELSGFPKGKHDDQVDTASGGLQIIAEGAGDWLTT